MDINVNMYGCFLWTSLKLIYVHRFITVYNGIEGMALQIFHPCHTGAITSFSPNLTVNLTADSRNGTEGIGVKFQWQ